MKDRLFKLKQLLISLSFALTSVSLVGCTDFEYEATSDEESIMDLLGFYIDTEDKIYAPGEHVLVVPVEIKNINDTILMDAPDGYEIIGIADATSDSYLIMYKNNVEVTVTPSLSGYNVFGTPSNQYTK